MRPVWRCRHLAIHPLPLGEIALGRFTNSPGFPSPSPRGIILACYVPVNFGSPAVHLMNILIKARFPMLLNRLTPEAMSITWKLFTVLALILLPGRALAGGKANHVVVVVWDGMRPDFVTRENTPNLMRLAAQGVEFTKHHPVYISTTEVNGTALSTGMYPGESGIVGNKEFRPGIDPSNKVLMEELEAVRNGDKLTGGHYLERPTLAEILHNEGMRTVIAGAKGVVLLEDRAARPGNALGINLFAGEVLPNEHARQLTGLLGQFPAQGLDGLARDLWTMHALVGPLWYNGVPPFSLLWLSEPDRSQHETGPGSAASIAAIRHSDEALGRVLACLDEKSLRTETDVIVVSDHGFSTVDQNAEVAEALRANGFHSYRTVPVSGAQKSDIMVVGNGGSVFLYVNGHQSGQIGRIVQFLQSQPFCGVVFAQQEVEGAFRLHDVRMDASSAPDIVISLRWKPDKSTNGAPGLIYSDYGKYGPGQGMHGSLSPFDMHNVCIAAGPDFRKGFQDDLPTGNIDIAPTILWLLGVKPPRQPSGRVLTEALTQSREAKPVCEVHRLEASWRGDGFTWHQYLKYSQVRGVLYFDEGNGEQTWSQASGAN